MINYVTGSIFNSTCRVIVNPVNCVGAMGKGLALEFKRRYPALNNKYITACKSGRLKIGTIMFCEVESKQGLRTVCLFPTKNHWSETSNLFALDLGLQAFTKALNKYQIESAAFPKIGCGLGGLSFPHEVQPLLEHYLAEIESTIDIYV